MKQKIVNGRWLIWTTNSIADWDALTGDASIPSGWEHARLTSMQQHLHYGDLLFEIGVEHGALTAVIAREFVGPENMVLCEPSPEFWVNIRKTWKWNGFAHPRAIWPGFIDSTEVQRTEGPNNIEDWPEWCHGDVECDAMAYRYLANPGNINSTTVDILAELVGVPTALNIDVEGAELRVLDGAVECLSDDQLQYVWVSIHDDLLANFGHTTQMLLDFMDEHGWGGTHLGTDHEAHFLFERLNP